MILTSLMQSDDNDMKTHACSALQTAVVVSDYREDVLTNIANSCDFAATVPPLLSSASPTVFQASSSLMATLLSPITDASHRISTTHPSHTIAINLHTPIIISSLMDQLTSPSIGSANATSVLVCLAAICKANNNSDILPNTNLANTCMSLLNDRRWIGNPENKQREYFVQPETTHESFFFFFFFFFAAFRRLFLANHPVPSSHSIIPSPVIKSSSKSSPHSRQRDRIRLQRSVSYCACRHPS